jgi:hypothetical protein
MSSFDSLNAAFRITSIKYISLNSVSEHFLLMGILSSSNLYSGYRIIKLEISHLMVMKRALFDCSRSHYSSENKED